MQTCTKNFDFSRSRVRLNGKSLDKFSVAYEIEQHGRTYNQRFMTKIYEVFSYVELSDMLKSLVS